MVTAAFLLCAGDGAAVEKVDIISQLRGLDVPEGLQQFLGAVASEIQGLKSENKALLKEQNRTRQENIVVQAKLEQVMKNKNHMSYK